MPESLAQKLGREPTEKELKATTPTPPRPRGPFDPPPGVPGISEPRAPARTPF